MRIVQGPGADESKNPFLLSEQEEKVVKKKQRENQHGLTVPRRCALPALCLPLRRQSDDADPPGPGIRPDKSSKDRNANLSWTGEEIWPS